MTIDAMDLERRRTRVQELPTAGWTLLLIVLVAFVESGFLLWQEQLTGVVVVQSTLLTLLCLVAPVQRLRAVTAVLTPIVGIAASQIVLLALPLPLLDPAERLALQGLGLWAALLATRWAAFPHLLSKRFWTQIVVSGLEPVEETRVSSWRVLPATLAAGTLVGVFVWLILPDYAPTRASTPGGLLIECVVAVALLVVPEELLWRGSLTPQLWKLLGPLGCVFEALLYASSYADSRRWSFVLLVALAAFAASLARSITGSVRWPILGHSLAVVLAVGVLPKL